MEFWTAMLVIVLVVALMLGPILWLKPSARDSRLASLRQRAAQNGLTVQMQPLPAALGEGSAAVYFAHWQNPHRLQTGWRLELRSMCHEMYFAGKWDWYREQPAPAAAWDTLRRLLQQLPGDATAVDCSDIGLGIQWREASGDDGFNILQRTLSAFSPLVEQSIRRPQKHPDRARED